MDATVLAMLNSRFDRLEDTLQELSKEVGELKNDSTAAKAKVKTATQLMLWVGGSIITVVNFALSLFLR